MNTICEPCGMRGSVEGQPPRCDRPDCPHPRTADDTANLVGWQEVFDGLPQSLVKYQKSCPDETRQHYSWRPLFASPAPMPEGWVMGERVIRAVYDLRKAFNFQHPEDAKHYINELFAELATYEKAIEATAPVAPKGET